MTTEDALILLVLMVMYGALCFLGGWLVGKNS